MRLYGSRLMDSYSLYKINIFKLKKQNLLRQINNTYRDGCERNIATTAIYQKFHFLVDIKKSEYRIQIRLFKGARYNIHNFIPYSIHEYRVRKVIEHMVVYHVVPVCQTKRYKIKLGSVFAYRVRR